MRISRSKVAKGVLLAFAAIGLFFLVTEHRAHTFGALPYILLAVCPLLLYLGAWHAETDVSADAGTPHPSDQERR
jgi:Protein of unknown function (DUF2933)